LLAVVGGEIAVQPQIRFGFVLRLVKMVKRLMRFLHGAEGTLNLALRSCGRAAPVRAIWHMRHEPHTKAVQHTLENVALCDWSVIAMDRFRDTLEYGAEIGLGRHRVEQEAQRCLDILVIDAVIFLVGNTGAVINKAVKHQGRRAAAGLDPQRRLRSDGLRSNCHSSLLCRAWNRTTGGARVNRTWS
jgi:hypothetical protein